MIITDDKQLIVLHETAGEGERPFALSAVLADRFLGNVIVDGLLANGCCGRTYLAAPARWRLNTADNRRDILSFNGHIQMTNELLEGKDDSYLILSNGRFHTNINYAWLKKTALSFDADMVLVNVAPTLAADKEKFRSTPNGQLAGIRRIYSDSAQKAPIPATWPCHALIHKSLLQGIFADGVPADFACFIKIAARNVRIASIIAGGTLLDIGTPEGLLAFAAETIKSPHANGKRNYMGLYNDVMVGQNVRIGKNVRLVGPAVISDNTDIGDDAIIIRSVIGSGISIAPKETAHDTLLIKSNDGYIQVFRQRSCVASFTPASNFRTWPRLSYARFAKRMADIVVAAVVLILFTPVIAIIAMLIKATSRGPVFFGHLRQGLHARDFRCFKFRSMIVGADDLQAKLRKKNEVDGPQFKMEDDPRVTPLGKFLRDTYLDEIPQFFNVLRGDMSVIGPRPSPEAENSQCAHWRDARLSVRPGITGLWQVCRTRKAGSDFQEWVHYDSQYVRQLSFMLDLSVFWRTTKYLGRAFLKQF